MPTLQDLPADLRETIATALLRSFPLERNVSGDEHHKSTHVQGGVWVVNDSRWGTKFPSLVPNEESSLLQVGPWLCRVILGPGTLGDDGDAYRLVAERAHCKRSSRWPTWRSVIEELRREWTECAIHYREHQRRYDEVDYELYICVQQNLPLLLRALIGVGDKGVENANWCSSDDPGRQVSLLHAAIPRAPLEIMNVLLECGADVNRDMGRHSTALYRAVEWGHGPSVERLLEAGASTMEENQPLMKAAEVGNLRIVQTLLAAGADVNARCPASGATALTYAIYRGNENVEIVETLLHAGADLNVVATGFSETGRRDGDTPLALAQKLGKGRIVALLEAAMRARLEPLWSR